MVGFTAGEEVHELGEGRRLFDGGDHDGERGCEGVGRLRAQRARNLAPSWCDPEANDSLNAKPIGRRLRSGTNDVERIGQLHHARDGSDARVLTLPTIAGGGYENGSRSQSDDATSP